MTYREAFRDEGVRFFVDHYKGSAENILNTYRTWRETEVHTGSQDIEETAQEDGLEEKNGIICK